MGIIRLKKDNAGNAVAQAAVSEEANAVMAENVAREWADPAVLGEDEAHIDAYSRHYYLNNGTAKSVISASPVNYRDEETGQWRTIDNTLSEKTDCYEAKFGKFKASVGKVSSGKKVSLSGKEISLTWEYMGASAPVSAKAMNAVNDESMEAASAENAGGSTLEVTASQEGAVGSKGSEAVYKNASPAVNLEYRFSGNNVKENIVVKEKAEEYRYLFRLDTQGLKLRLSEDNANLELYSEKTKENGEKEEVLEFTIPSPYMYDANEATSEEVYYELEPEENAEGKYAFAVVADADWMNAPDRVFPVTIDPQIVSKNDVSFLNYSNYVMTKSSSGSTYWNPSSSAYIEAGETTYQYKKSSIFINKSSIALLYKNIVSVKLTLKPRTYTSGYVQLNGKKVYINGSKVTVDVTSCFKNGQTITFEPSSSSGGFVSFYTTEEEAPVLEIEYITNENVKPTKKTISLVGGIVEGVLDVRSGELVSEFADIDDSGSLLGVGISHAYKKDATNFNVGRNFRLNLHEKFEENSSSTMDADYAYTDSEGVKHAFKDFYYYFNSDRQKVYVKKEDVSIDQNQVLSYATSEKTYRVYKEQRTSSGLQAITLLSDFQNCDLIEQRHEEVYESEENIKQLNKQKESYTHNIAYYKAEKSRLGVQKALYQLQKSIQTYSNNMQDAQNKIEDFKKSEGYAGVEEEYKNFTKRCEEFNKAELEYRLNKEGLSSVYGDFRNYLETTTYSNADSFHEARKTVFAGHEDYIDDDANENGTIKEVFNYHYTNYINALGHELEKIIDDALNQEYDSKSIKDYLLYAQEKIVETQKEILGGEYDTDFDAQINEIDYTLTQAEKELEEVEIALIKAEHEHKLLLRHDPVNYLTDGTIYKGFNKYGDLVVIYDGYDNTVAVEYEDYDLSEDGEAYRIRALYDNEENQITFDYNDDGLLTSITDKRGRKTKYTYNANGYLEKVEYTDGKTLTIGYSGTDICSMESSDKVRSEMTYSSSKLTGVKTYSLTTEIARGGANTVSKSDSTMIEQWLVSYSSSTKTVITLREKSGVISDSNKSENIREHYIFNTDGNNTAYYLEEYGKVTQAEKYNYKAYISERTEYAQKSKLNVSAYTDGFAFGTTDYEETVFDEFNNPKTTTKYNYISTSSNVKVVTSYTYDDNHKCEKTSTVTTITTSKGNKTYTGIIKYNYNAQGKLVRAESYIEGEELTKGKTIEERFYDKNGNVKKSYTYNSLDSSTKTYSESEYAENGRVLADFDETGSNKTEYDYIDGTDVIRSKKFPNGSKLSYGYDVDDSVTSITQSTEAGEENSTHTLYTCGQVTELVSGNNKVEYSYDYKRRLTAIGYNGNATYETYEYTEGTTEDTVKTVNALNETFTTVSDKRGNVIRTLIDGEQQSASSYNSDGKVTQYADSVTGAEVNYSYDTADGKLLKAERLNFAALTETLEYTEYNEIQQRTLTGAVSQVYTYTYKDTAERELEKIALPNGLYYYPQKDKTERNTGKELKTATGERKAGEYIFYRKVGDHATSMPSAVYFGGIRNGTYEIRDNMKYSYDESGNISKITENGELYTRYGYDGLNRLVREDNKKLGKTYLYSYDNNGNILSRKQTSFTLREDVEECVFTTDEYGYDGDRLMSYGNERCEYDDIGNPTKYCGLTLIWEKGRQLSKIGEIELKYDASGRRVKRGDVEFVYDDSGNLIKSDGMEFCYDETGVTGVKYDGKQYVYRKDAQGNIVALLDETYQVVVKYIYDAWGNVTAYDASGSKITDGTHIGIKNPFRYRGYYYDEELDWYYLQTRYYDPETGRFITIDDVSYLAPDTINGLNLYAYCGNNPVMNVDPNGTWSWSKFWKTVAVVVVTVVVVAAVVAVTVVTGGAAAPVLASAGIGAVTSGVVSGVTQYATTGYIDLAQLFVDVAFGTVTGAFGGSTLGALGMAIAGGVTGFMGSVAGDFVAGQDIQWGMAVVSGVIGAVFGAASHGGAQYGKNDTLKMKLSLRKQKMAEGKPLRAINAEIKNERALLSAAGLRALKPNTELFSAFVVDYIIGTALPIIYNRGQM